MGLTHNRADSTREAPGEKVSFAPGRNECALCLEFKLDKFFGSAWLGAMKIPEFKPSKHFLDDTDLPCLLAKVKNSKLPGVATRDIAEFKKDLTCKIYLRGKDPKKISKWQQEILEKLFAQEGLAAAIEEAMKEYEKSSDAYCDFSKRDRAFAKKHGIAPFITVSMIVIDAIQREVIFAARSIYDGNLDEHGISIYLKKGRWRFDDRDYFITYRSSFGADYATRKEQLEIEHRDQKWGALFPPPDSKTPAETDCSFIYGRWEIDVQETNRILKHLGHKPITAIGQFHEISKTTLDSFLVIWERRIVGFERRGNWVTINEEILSPEFMKGKSVTQFWCDGKILVQQGGLAYRRRKLLPRK